MKRRNNKKVGSSYGLWYPELKKFLKGWKSSLDPSMRKPLLEVEPVKLISLTPP